MQHCRNNPVSNLLNTELLELAVLPQRDELIERCLKGDTLGYKELYVRYSKAMYNTNVNK